MSTSPRMGLGRLLLGIGAALVLCPASFAAATVTRAPWGKDPSGKPVDLYTITMRQAEVKVTTYGARIVSIRVPDREGKMGSVVIGFNSVDGYFSGRTAYMGATIGRYANRIAGGQFTLNGVTYHIPKNAGNNALHGGTIGFNQKVWSAREVPDGVEMTLVSPDGDMGFPGRLVVHVTFTLASRNGNAALTIAYQAATDKPTVINLTNHAYFNLAGEGDGQTSVLEDLAKIQADEYTPVDNSAIPTGKVLRVAGTPYDFRVMHPIGERIPKRGYDINLVLHTRNIDEAAAEVEDPRNGRSVRVFTTEPGLQLYVPLFPAVASRGTGRAPLAAFCLETQHFPDSPNYASFPSTVLLPGKQFESKTIYVFGASGLR